MHSRRAKRLARLGHRTTAVGFIVFLFSTLLAPITSGVEVGGSVLGGFENDGNLLVDTSGNLDWNSPLPNLSIVLDDTLDSGFQGSSKELKPSEWVCDAGGASPGKSNLLRAYLNSMVVDETDAYLNIAWVRHDAGGKGDVHVNYEFNQQGTATAAPISGPCPIERTAGDLLVTYDFDGGGSLPDINLYRWQPHAVPTSNEDGQWVNGSLPADAVKAAVNDITVADPLHGNASIEPLRFGEATINLTAALAASGVTDCSTFGVANIRSRSSGESWTSALQDNMPGMPINVTTCPGIEIVKTGVDMAHEGDEVTYDFAVTNTGAVRLTDVTVTDDVLGAIGDIDELAVGQTVELEKAFTVPPSTDEVVNEATACGFDPRDTEVCDTDDHTLNVIHPDIEVAKTGTAMAREGDLTSYSFQVTNTGDVDLTDVSVVDDVLGHIGDIGALATGASQTLSTASVAPADDVTNVATACGTDPLDLEVCDDDDHSLDVIHPAIEVVKTGTDMAHEGDVTTYSFAVTNSGDVALTNVSVTDAPLGHIGDIASLAVGETQTLTFDSIAPDSDLTNLATACGLDPLDNQVCSDDDHTLTVIRPDIEIVKAGTSMAREGDITSYSFQVTNTGDVDLTDVSVVDDQLGHIGNIASLAVGASQTLTADAVAPASDLTNVGEACGLDPLDREVCDDDDHFLDVISPDIHIVKTGADIASEGDAVLYFFTVTNTGDVDLTDVSVIDDKLGHIGDIAGFAVGQTEVLMKLALAPAADVTNVAEACGLDPLDREVCDDDDHFLDVISPDIQIVKTGATMAREGDVTTYSFQVTNTGDVDLTGVAVTDDVLGHIGDIGALAVGASQTLTADAVAPASGVTNVAEACGLDPLARSVCDDDDHTLVVIHPDIHIVKTGASMAREGQTVTYSFEVTNTGDVDLTGVAVTDDVLGHIGDIGALAVGASQTLTADAVAPASGVTNVAEACGLDPLARPVCDDDDHTLVVIHPAIEIVKTGTSMAHQGDTTTYSFAVTNTGDVDLTGVSVVDAPLGHIGNIASLTVGETKTLTFDSVAPADDLTNLATACGLDALALEVCDDDDHDLDVIHPAIEIVKTGADRAHEGDTVTYSFEVTNTGDVELTGVAVTDDVLGHIGDIGALAVGASHTLTTDAVAPAADVRNMAETCGLDPLDRPVCDDDDHVLDIINPGIEVIKSGASKAHEGTEVTYTFEVTNTGDVPLTVVTVTDDVLGLIDTIPTLGVGATAPLQKTFVVPAGTDEVVNVVTACGIGPIGAREFCDTDLHVLDVIHPAVTLDKQLAGADHKPVDDALITHEGEELGYTLLITNAGDTPLEILGLEDTLVSDLGGACSAHLGAVLGAGEVITCAYTLTAPGPGIVHNVASVLATDELGGPSGTVADSDETFARVVNPGIEVVKTGPPLAHQGDEVTYTFEVTNTGDVTLTDVTVTDDVLGDIGTVDSLAPGESVTLTSDFVVPAGATSVTNLATACGTDPADLVVCDDDPHTSVVITPDIQVVKTADPVAVVPGQQVTYTYVVTNTGDTPLADVTVDDDVLGRIGTIEDLGAGETVTLTFAVVIAEDTPRVNIATACGTDALDLEVCDTDDATISIVLPSPPEARVPQLPFTGFRMMLWLSISAALMASGLVMMDVQRNAGRRRIEPPTS